jgi:hypothetical protein
MSAVVVSLEKNISSVWILPKPYTPYPKPHNIGKNLERSANNPTKEVTMNIFKEKHSTLSKGGWLW